MAKGTAVSNEEIIAALLSSGTINEAAAAVGISPRTVYDRMSTKEFKAAYNAAKTDIIRQAVFDINRNLTEAIKVVADIMKDSKENSAIRLKAAQTIISNAQKFTEHLQHEENIIATNSDNYDPFNLF